MSLEALGSLLSAEGWPYASAPPVEPGDPGRFHALFGRDSLICSLQVLPARPEVAAATLRALAALQGRTQDADTDEEPGKILHEHRPQAPDWLGGQLGVADGGQHHEEPQGRVGRAVVEQRAVAYGPVALHGAGPARPRAGALRGRCGRARVRGVDWAGAAAGWGFGHLTWTIRVK